MKALTVLLAGMSALAVLAGAEAAHAQQARVRAQAPAPSATPAPDAYQVQTAQGQQPNQINPQTRRSTLRWDAVRGRWGLQLDMDQAGGRDLQWRDVQAGAYYSVTRQLRVGGSVGVAEQDNLASRRAAPPRSPRVQLETAFRF